MISTRCSVNPDGQTPYQSLHGKRAPDRLVEFGELVYYYVPKKLRFKLDVRSQLALENGNRPRHGNFIERTCRWDAQW